MFPYLLVLDCISKWENIHGGSDFEQTSWHPNQDGLLIHLHGLEALFIFNANQNHDNINLHQLEIFKPSLF
jgi:hypothetical protein